MTQARGPIPVYSTTERWKQLASLPGQQGSSRYAEALVLSWEITDLRTGETRTGQECAGQNGGTASPGAGAPAPEEVFRSVPLPPTQVSMSPPGYGVVGFATYFWYEDPGVVEVPVSVRGWTGTATVTLERYTWSVGNDGDGDGAADVVTGPAGTAEVPSAT
ncbi:MAG: hypothetical protein ACT4PW_04985 [Acidimicrobiia bacterium]